MTSPRDDDQNRDDVQAGNGPGAPDGAGGSAPSRPSGQPSTQSTTQPSTQGGPVPPRRMFLSPLVVSLLAVVVGTTITFFTFKALSDRATDMAGGLGNAIVALAGLYGGGFYLLVAMVTQLFLGILGRRQPTPARLLGRSTLVASVALVLACLVLALATGPQMVLAALVIAILVLLPILVLVGIGWLICRRTVWSGQPGSRT